MYHPAHSGLRFPSLLQDRRRRGDPYQVVLVSGPLAAVSFFGHLTCPPPGPPPGPQMLKWKKVTESSLLDAKSDGKSIKSSWVVSTRAPRLIRDPVLGRAVRQIYQKNTRNSLEKPYLSQPRGDTFILASISFDFGLDLFGF